MTRTSKHTLLAGVALSVLISAATGAMAQMAVDQSATNNATVIVNPSTITLGAGNFGAGASSSIGAVGAVSATSVTGINQNLNSPTGGISTVSQKAVNNADADVTNTGTINANGVSSTSVGASISISATGAAASLGITGINSTTIMPVGNVDQTIVKNDATITNTGTIDGPSLSISGSGTSVSVSANGAIASVSVTSISSLHDPEFGTIDQSPNNTGNVTNTATQITPQFINGSGLTSVSASATGAASVVSTGFDNGGNSGGTFDAITQTTTNSGTISNTATNITSQAGGFQTGGAAISASATGAVSSVSQYVNSEPVLGGTFAAIKQTTINSGGGVTNSAPTISVGDAIGPGGSVSASATGAASSVSYTLSGSSYVTGTTFADVTQSSTNSAALVKNDASTMTTGDLGFNTAFSGLNGAGASVSSGATGAVASISVTSYNSFSLPVTTTFGIIKQDATNNTTGGVTNVNSTLNVGELKGSASSASVSATGAITSVSATSINNSTGETPLKS